MPDLAAVLDRAAEGRPLADHEAALLRRHAAELRGLADAARWGGDDAGSSLARYLTRQETVRG